LIEIEHLTMTIDQANLPARERRRWQFSLKTMFLITIYVAVVGSVCTMLNWYWPGGLPLWLKVFFFAWTAAVVAQLASCVWGWWWLHRLAGGMGAPPGGDAGNDLSGADSRRACRRRFRTACVWVGTAVVLWLTFTATFVFKSRGGLEGDSGWMVVFCVVVLHLVPYSLVSYIQYARKSRGREETPVKVMRLSSVVGFVLPAVALSAYWLLSL
jgi:hypothetical protein